MAEGRAVVEVETSPDAVSLAKTGKIIEKQLSRIGDEAGNRFSHQFDVAIGRSGVLISAITLAAAPAVTAVDELAGAATALGTSLFNTASAGLSFVGILGALGQAAVVAAIGFSGFAKAIAETDPTEFAKLTKDMAPNMVEAIKAVQGFSGEWLKLKQAIQTNAFEGLGAQIEKIGGQLLPVLKAQFAETGTVLNGIFTQFAGFLTSTGFVTDFNTVLGANNLILKELGASLVPLTSGFFNLFMFLQPAALRTAEAFGDLAVRFSEWTNQAGQAERVDQFMQRVQHTAALLFEVLGNLGGALLNIFRAASPAGDSFLKMLIDVTQRFQDFTASAAGQNAIAQWAERGVEGMRTLGPLFTEIGKLFKALSDPGTLDAVVQILVHFASTAQLLAPVLETVVKTLGLFAPIIGPLLAFAAVGSTFLTLGKVLGIAANGFFMIARAVLFAMSILGGWPVLIGLLIGGLVLLWNNSETFRDIVKGAWEGIKTAAAAVVDWFTGTALPALQSVWDAIKTGFSAVVGFLTGAWNGVVAVFTVVFGAIKAAVIAVFMFLKPVIDVWLAGVMIAFKILQIAVVLVFLAIKAIVMAVFAVLKAIASVYIRAIQLGFEVLKIVVTAVWDAIKEKALAVFNFLKPYILAVVEAVQEKWNAFKEKMNAIWEAIKSKVVPIWEIIKEKVTGWIEAATAKFEQFKAKLTAIWDGVKEAGLAAFDKLKNAINLVIRGVNKAIDLVNQIPGNPFTIGKIPELAVGARNFSGGLALVGEQGPELVNLPRGSDVYTAQETEGMLGGGNTVIFNSNYYGPTTGSERKREIDWTLRFGLRYGVPAAAVGPTVVEV